MSKPHSLTIAGHNNSVSEPLYVIAEMSCNNNGSLNHVLAREALGQTGFFRGEGA